MAASRFLATTLCRWTVHRVIVLEAPIGGLRKCPRTTKALRPHVDLLVDSSMIGYLTASETNVSPVEEDCHVVTVRVHLELVRDVLDVVAGLLQLTRR